MKRWAWWCLVLLLGVVGCPEPERPFTPGGGIAPLPTQPSPDDTIVDGGVADPDGGTADPDAGTADPDAGTADPDGGTLDPDAGTIDPDGGTADPDGGTSDPDGGLIGGPEVARFWEALLEVRCRTNLRCYGAALVWCLDTACSDPVWPAEAERVRLAVAAGRLLYNPAQAEACLAAIAAAPCQRSYPAYDQPACHAALTGAVQRGVPCAEVIADRALAAVTECVDGFCARGATCPGYCAPWFAVGEQCAHDGQCDPSAAHCRDGQCVALSEVGDACATVSDCARGLDCNADGACVQPGPLGSVCGEDAECESRLCAGGLCVDSAPLGGRCSFDPHCPVGATCIPIGGQRTCMVPYTVPEGGACSTCYECEAGLECDYAAGLCVVQPGLGEACTGYDCGDLAYCDASVSPAVCRPYAGLGQPCATSFSCEGELICDTTAVCSPRKAVGEPCDGLQCDAWGTCVGGVCAAKYCEP